MKKIYLIGLGLWLTMGLQAQRMDDVAVHSQYITVVDEYRPAPGQFVNMMPKYEQGDDAARMAQKCTESLANNQRDMVCLGGYGGYSPYGGSTTTSSDPFGGFPFGWGTPFGTTSRRTTYTRSRGYQPKAGANVEYDLTISDETAKKGGRRGITYQHYATCEHCHGDGSVESAQPVTCPTCNGTGRMTVDLTSVFGFGVMEVTCPECEGAGRVVANPCEACGGSGRVLSASEVVIDIPPESHDGDEVRIAGAGNAGTNGEASGDFVCKIGVPSEQVSYAQARGFHSIGFAVPVLLVCLLTQTLGGFMGFFLAVMVIMGVIELFQGGSLTGHTSRWWKNALGYFLGGFTQGVYIAFFFAMLELLWSCTITGFKR